MRQHCYGHSMLPCSVLWREPVHVHDPPDRGDMVRHSGSVGDHQARRAWCDEHPRHLAHYLGEQPVGNRRRVPRPGEVGEGGQADLSVSPGSFVHPPRAPAQDLGHLLARHSQPQHGIPKPHAVAHPHDPLDVGHPVEISRMAVLPRVKCGNQHDQAVEKNCSVTQTPDRRACSYEEPQKAAQTFARQLT